MLEVRVARTYPAFQLDASFEAQAPITALIGPSGAGKTQTLRAIAGAMRPDRGRIVLDEHSVPHPAVMFFVNDDQVCAATCQLRDGDVLTIMPPISGG